MVCIGQGHHYDTPIATRLPGPDFKSYEGYTGLIDIKTTSIPARHPFIRLILVEFRNQKRTSFSP